MTSRLLVAATLSYTANCGLGTAVATRTIRTDDVRWVHHALYVVTSMLTGAATVSALWRHRRVGWFLLPTVVPLVLISQVSARSPRHIAVAASAAPFFAAALVASRRDASRRTAA